LIRDLIQTQISLAIGRLQASGTLPAGLDAPIEVADPRDPSHGDFACNYALVASKQAGMNPRELAEKLKEALLSPSLFSTPGENEEGVGGWRLFGSIEIAGPGFLNIRVTDEAWMESIAWANERGASLPKPPRPVPDAQRINIEFVSVNPNGPITVGSGRGAAFGSTLANVMETVGHEVHREYYINDGTNSEQMRLFAESVKSLVEGLPFPDKGYKGDYVHDVAAQLAGGAMSRSVDEYQQLSQTAMLDSQRMDLSAFATTFNTWFSEQSLHDSGKVEQSIDHLIKNGAADEEPVRRKLKLAKGGKIEDVEVEIQPVEEEDEAPGDGHQALGSGPGAQSLTPDAPTNRNTLWLRSTKFGDDMDRVLRRKDGRLTYIASDVAYHKDKFNRPANADKLITILGPDHHGYISRLHAVLAALELGAPGVGHQAYGSEPYSQGPAPDAPLSEIDAKIYGSKEERDACRAALEKAQKELEVIIFQIVRFVKEGKPAPMRKRDGNIYSLRDLMTEIGKDAAPHLSPEEQIVVGKDVARFFYLMRSHDTHMDFDIDLATKGTDENPVFYVQYAHARICSILRKAEEAMASGAGHQASRSGSVPDAQSPTPGAEGLMPGAPLHPKESALIKKVLDLPWEVQRCAEDYGVHRLTTYAIELARTFHHFYDACRVIQPEEPELTKRRLAICEATRHALQGALKIVGVSAPEKMERAESAAPVMEI